MWKFLWAESKYNTLIFMFALAFSFTSFVVLCGFGCSQKHVENVMIEFRLTETEPVEDLVEMKIRGTKETFYVHEDVVLSNRDIASASVCMWHNRPVVELICTDTGSKQLAALTEKHINKHIGILVDGILVSAPLVKAPIVNGRAVINGNFTMKEAQRIADDFMIDRKRKGTGLRFRFDDAQKLMQSYMEALKNGDKTEIYRYWSTQSIEREGFDYMHLWIGECIPISQWEDFFRQHDCSYEINTVRSIEDYHIIDFEWNVRNVENGDDTIGLHPMRYYIIREDDRWVLINPIDILTRDWLVYETDSFLFHYPPHIEIDDYIPELKFMDQEYQKIAGFLDIELAEKIQYYKARHPQECGELVNFPPANGYCARGLPFRPDTPRWFHVLISTSFINLHEIIHLLAPQAELYSINDAFDEGIAVALGGTTFHTPEVASIYTRDILNRPDYVPLQTLLTDKEVFWRSSHVTYMQAGSFIRFLLDQYGLEPLRTLCNEPAAAEDLQNTIRKVYGFTISELEEKWHEYLLQTDIPEIGYSIPEDAEVIFSMVDPQGDDNGDGNYSYPPDERFREGVFDLRRFEVLKDEKQVYFRLKLQNMIEPVTYHSIEERFVPGAVIAISTGGNGEQYGQRRFDGIQLDDNKGYHLKLCIGFGVAVANRYGKICFQKKDSLNDITKKEHNSFECSLPIDFLGEPDDNWEYFVGVGLMGDRLMHFTCGPMPVHKKHRIFLNGGNYEYGNPQFIDILLPEGRNQQRILGEYDAPKGRLAIVPMIKKN